MTAETRRESMRIRPTPWVVLGLVLASALFVRTDSPALADTATVYPQVNIPIPFQGLRSSGVTLTATINASQTSVPISDPARLKVGQIVETQDTSKEIMEVTGLGTSTMDVTRGVLGTSAASHNNGTALYSDFTAVRVQASGVGYRPTGATLSAAVDAGTLDTGLSGAFLAQSIGKTETTINVTDATLLTDATVVRIDGTAYVSATNTSFLASTGRVPMQTFNTVAGDSITFGYATLGWSFDGPTGSGILAEVRLRAEHLGAVSLDLQNVILSDWQGHKLTVGEVLGASATVVSGSPTPPSPPSPNCGGTGVKVCILPSSQNVGLGNEFTAYVAVQNVWKEFGYGLGGYQFTLKWAPATEEVSVQSVHRGYLTDGGANWYRNAILTAPIDETVTNLPLSGTGTPPLQAGYTARLDPDTGEEMLITAVSAMPTPSMTVIRGYHGTTPTAHVVNAAVFAGPERMTVARASLPAPHSAGADFRDNLRVLRVSDQSLLTASALQIDSERFKVEELPARTLHDTGLTLTSSVNTTDTVLHVSAAGLQKGWILQVESELMPVTAAGSGTVTVVRGFFGSQASSHSAGTAIKAVSSETNTVRASRGFQSTPVQSHAAGASITDVDGLGGYGFTLSSPGVPAVIGFVWADNSTFLGQTGRTVQCTHTPPSGNISFQCNTTGALPLGPTGSGTLATVNVTGKQLVPNAPSQALNLSGVTLHDISGDALLPVSTATGTVRVVGCPDFDGNRVVNFAGDVINIARAVLIGPPAYPTEPEHDVDRNGSINFVGDVITTAQVALTTEPQPLRCPP
jgi:hypothetical protein